MAEVEPGIGGTIFRMVHEAPRSSEQGNEQRAFTVNIHLRNNLKHQNNDRPARIEGPEWGGVLFVL